jgi:hypothetical protein
VELAVGEQIGFALPVDFIEEPVSSIELNGGPVDPAPPGANVGVKSILTKAQARTGTAVYRIAR